MSKLGVAPINYIIKFAEKNQVEWVIIENDTPNPNGIKDVTLSIKKL